MYTSNTAGNWDTSMKTIIKFRLLYLAVSLAILSLQGLLACSSETKQAPSPLVVEVTTVKTKSLDVPVAFEFVGQTQSSHQEDIRARVEGFLDKRLYEEGSLVETGQEMFQMDRRPFEASLQEARGELAQQQARWDTARSNLARIQPLADKNAVSKKDLDDAVGNEKSAAAAVISAQGKVRQAELNLGYTTIVSPVSGAASQAKKQEGSYISMGPESLLTTVAKLNPIWVHFSVSENEQMKLLEETKKGKLRSPKGDHYDVEILLSDGSPYPRKGRLNFADPSFNEQTGTFLVRAVIANPSPYILRPGQFVRVRLLGAVRPHAITVPRRAVMQGAKGHFVWIVDKNGKSEFRKVVVGDWYGDQCFVSEGLGSHEEVVVDGGLKLAPAMPVKVVETGKGMPNSIGAKGTP